MLRIILFSRYKKRASTNVTYTIPRRDNVVISVLALDELYYSEYWIFGFKVHSLSLYTLIEFTYILYHNFAQTATKLKYLHKSEVFVKERLQFYNNAILFSRSVAAAKARDRRQNTVNVCAGSL